MAASREAVRLTPGSPEMAGRLSDLGNALQILSEGSGVSPGAGGAPQADDARQRDGVSILREAVRAGREAVAVSPAGTVTREPALLALVRALAQREAEPKALREMRRRCDELVAEAVLPCTRVLAHLFLGRAAMSAKTPETEMALAAYEEAVARLPEIAPRRLARPDREHGLGELAGLPAEAASVALSLGRPEHALLLLEHARGLLLRESMGSRGDLRELRRIAPAAAEEFVRLRDLLDASDQTRVDLYRGGVQASASLGDRARRHRQLAERWEVLLADIRRLPGLDDILRAPTIEPLRRQAADGPIVLVNAGRYRCDAMILAADAPVRTLKLECGYAELWERAEAFRTLRSAASDGPDSPPRVNEQRILRDLAWLWDRIAKPVLADLGLLSSSPRPAADAPPIWWCPIGVAAFLPLHAAGRHADAEPGIPSTVMDHVVSSYVSTVSTLHFGRERRASGVMPSGFGNGEFLVVEMSQTPGARPLPGARAETRRVAELVPNLTRLAGPQATRDAVLGALPRHRVAHFACHAVTDSRSPSLNRLLLHDRPMAPLTSIELSAVNVPVADLAYLSSCETARSSEALIDEAVHIAVSFQLAGYRRVVGTLWPVSDSAAARIADDFYTELGPSLNASRTARALHQAICALRTDTPSEPSRWAAHVHFGD